MGVMSHPSYMLSELPNGLRYLFVPVAGVPAVYISIMGTVGRRAELDDEVGAAHFLEHVFFDGTPRRPSALAVSQYIDELGGIKNGSTGQELVSYHVKLLDEHLEAGIDIVSDIFLNALMEQSAIDKERLVIAQEAATARDDPMGILFRKRLAALYPSQRVGRTVFDEDVNLPNINWDVLRRYMDRNYHAGNFLLCIAGKADAIQARQLAQQYFGNFRPGTRLVFEPARFHQQRTVTIDIKDVVQSKLALSFEGFAINDPHATAADLLATMLGSGLSSRLGNRLRNELHLAYHVSSNSINLSDTGFFSIVTLVDEAKVQQTTTEIIAQIQLLLNAGVAEGELEKAKNMLLSRLVFASENVAFVGNDYARQQLLAGKILDLTQQIAAIKGVTVQEIAEVAKLVFGHQPKLNLLTKSLQAVELPSLLL